MLIKVLILSYDCQKNLPLPKVPDQSTYYSKQVYLHNFTIVRGNSKAKLIPENVTVYSWTEIEFPKDSSIISSCVYNLLELTDTSGYQTIRLVSDGCSVQNKNSTIVSMVSSWLASKANEQIKVVEILYPLQVIASCHLTMFLGS